MTSESKKRKLYNAHLDGGFLKYKTGRLKRLFFFTASQRKFEKDDTIHN